MIKLTVNGAPREVDADADTPLLWVLREWLGMTGTKYGCGIAQCGACTVHVQGQATRACIATMQDVAGKSIVTIEGLSPDGRHPVQRAWVDHRVSQCGYCQAGQVMQAAALLATTPSPTDQQIDDAMGGNLCRCGTYNRIREAIHGAAARS